MSDLTTPTASAAAAATDAAPVVVPEEQEVTTSTTTEDKEESSATAEAEDAVAEVTQSLEEILALGQGLDDEDYKAELDVLQNDPSSNLYSAVTFEELNLYVCVCSFSSYVCACVCGNMATHEWVDLRCHPALSLSLCAMSVRCLCDV